MEKRRIFVEVTQDELMLLDLFKNAHHVDFHRFHDGIEVGKAFVERFGEAKYWQNEERTSEWYKSEREIDGVQVKVISFLEKEWIENE